MILYGERGRNRTYNLLIKSQLLCQLSYAPLRVAAEARHDHRATEKLYHPAARGISRNNLRVRRQRCRGNLRDVQQLGREFASPRPARRGTCVWQNGQAVPIIAAPVATSSSARSTIHALALLFAQEHLPAAGAAAERALARARRFDHIRRTRQHRARLRRTRRDNGPDSRDRGTPPCSRGLRRRGSCVLQARQQLAVMLDLEGGAILPPVGPDGAHAVRADGDHLADLAPRAAFRYWPPPPARPPGRCPGGAPDRRCISPCAARRT